MIYEKTDISKNERNHFSEQISGTLEEKTNKKTKNEKKEKKQRPKKKYLQNHHQNLCAGTYSPSPLYLIEIKESDDKNHIKHTNPILAHITHHRLVLSCAVF